MQLCYLSERYASIRRVAGDYARMLAPLCARPEDADTLFWHGSLGVLPARTAAVHKTQRWLGYIVWEAEQLPETALPMLSRFDELWTASTYCARILRQHHDNVHVVPHVAEPPAVATKQSRSYVDRILARAPGDVLMLALAAWDDPRKNLTQLMRCYARVQRPGMRLVVKTVPPMQRLGARTDCIWWSQWLDPPALTSLIDACDVVCSFHHGEGWGLNLSDAMALGKLTVATGYSGNVDFMHPGNSLLVPYTLGPVQDAVQPFSRDMQWAQLADGDVERALVRAFEAVRSGEAKTLGAQAREDMQRYSRAAVTTLVMAKKAALAKT